MISVDLTKSILILGCGNALFGDDGFGPGVVQYFKENYAIPPHVLVQDVGTGIWEVLFDVALGASKPRKLIIVDAVDYPDRAPGEVFEIPLDSISPRRTPDFSVHQFPTANILKELQDQTGLAIHIIVTQAAHLPSEVKPGLSAEVRSALPETCRRLLDLIST